MKNHDKICLGTVKLGIPNYGFSSAAISERFDPIGFLSQVEQCGLRRFDTSPRYGGSEEILGRYFEQSSIQPIVSSKIDNLRPGMHETIHVMQSSVRASLSRLKLKQLDICYLHQNELEIISDPYVHDGIQLLKAQGIIRQAGASPYSFEECDYAVESGVFDIIQIPVSVFDLRFYNRYVKESDTPVRFAARSLLLQGILMNRVAACSPIRQWHEIVRYLESLEELAEEYDLSMLEMALPFVFSLKNIDHYVIGTTSIANLKKNIACIEKEIPMTLFERLYRMASQPKTWVNPREWSM